MRSLCVLFVLVVAASAEEPKPRQLKYARDDIGKLPAGWTAAKTGEGEGSVWKVVDDGTAPGKLATALAQTAKSPRQMFNLCVANDTNLKDVELGVAFKAVRGEVDQGGGLVWRYQDANNYYVARMNPLEGNFRLYKVVAGKREQLASKGSLTIPSGEWHTMSIKHVRDQIECSLDRQKLLEAKDDTIQKAGKVGLWTKADAETYFGELLVSGK